MKMEHFLRWRKGESSVEANRGKRENVADHTPIHPSHSSPAHPHSSLHCSLTVSVSRWDWVRGQSSQELQFLWCGTGQAPAVDHAHAAASSCSLAPMTAEKEQAPSPEFSVRHSHREHPVQNRHSSDSWTLCVGSKQEGCKNLKSKMWNIIKICKTRCLV